MELGRAASANLALVLKKVRSGRSVLDLGDRQVIFSQGEPARWVFYVSEGRIKLTAVSASGREAIVSLLDPGLFFGEVSLLSGRPRFTTSAAALGSSIVVRLERHAITRLLRKNSQFSERFLAHLVAQHARAQDDLVDQRVNPAEKRLARLLLLMANLGPGSEAQAVIPKISQETLGQMIGADRSRVSLLMNRFKKLGLISYDHELRIYANLRTILTP
ncbi:MAG: Crp/Fnr family transcriptional regulator [Terriglobia bacterium]